MRTGGCSGSPTPCMITSAGSAKAGSRITDRTCTSQRATIAILIRTAGLTHTASSSDCLARVAGNDDLDSCPMVAMRGPSRCGMKQPYTPRHPGLSDALQAYEACGFDTAAIRQWCIPELDAEMLVEATLQQRPTRILEVGTYVGVSTLLMALATDPDATIVTIDPNLPLGTGMGSMQSDLGRLDAAARTHDVARAAARELGVDQRIRFIEGGFAIGETFSSS